MHVLQSDNVNTAYEDGLWWLKVNGTMTTSRNGRVIVAPGPVTTVYRNPRHRVLFSKQRDANPFFHFFESMWMLAGRDDLAYVEQFVKRMRDYSDDGVHLQGAYGYRWRQYWQFDQLNDIVRMLISDPDSRRAVITMWDPLQDLGANSKDIPCNTHIYIEIREGFLNMTVCCRSNDAVWGAYGANVVHMSFLQEYLACALARPIGTYTQFSNNFHIYTDMPRFEELWLNPTSENLYSASGHLPGLETGPLLFHGPHTDFAHELRGWVEQPTELTSNPFLSGVAYPMWQAFIAHKTHRQHEAYTWADGIDAPDWRAACTAWLERRYEVDTDEPNG